MKPFKALLHFTILSLLPLIISAKAGGEYSTIPVINDYGGADYGQSYQKTVVAETPAIVTSPEKEYLKPSGTFEFGYGAPPPLPILPFQKFGFGGGFGGWKQPIIPIQVIAKPIPVPVATIPFGLGWGHPGIFR